MEENILDIFNCDVTCDINSCAMRYYIPHRDFAVGLIRFHHFEKEGRVSQHVVTILSMEIDKMIEHIMENYDFNPQDGDKIVNLIREDAQKLVKEHLGIIN